MAQISKATVDKNLRDSVFADLFEHGVEMTYYRINDRQWGTLITDLNGVQRYVRIGAIVAEAREEITAEELMQSEIDKYNESVAKQKEKKRKAAEKAQKDK